MRKIRTYQIEATDPETGTKIVPRIVTGDNPFFLGQQIQKNESRGECAAILRRARKWGAKIVVSEVEGKAVAQ